MHWDCQNQTQCSHCCSLALSQSKQKLLLLDSIADRDRRKKIMMTIGDSLNEVWSDDKWLNLKLKRVKLFFLNSNGCIAMLCVLTISGTRVQYSKMAIRAVSYG